MRYSPRTDPDVQSTRTLRDTVGHAVISLPSWEELGEAEKCDCHSALYQICRLTVGLYLTAVMLARPPHSGWQTIYVERMRSLIEFSGFAMWSVDVGPVLLWVLCVGGIAAYRTKHRAFFEQTLRRELLSSTLRSWPEVRECLKGFMWTDGACEYGAAVLWDAVNPAQEDLRSSVFNR